MHEVFERPRRKQFRGVNRHVFLRNFIAVGGMGAYSVKYGNKNLEDKNNSNKIILTGIFLKLMRRLFFLTSKGEGVVST